MNDVWTTEVTVCTGDSLSQWRNALPTGVLEADQIERARAGLLETIRIREAAQRERDGAPPLVVDIGPFGILNRLTTGVGGGLASWALAGLVLKALRGHGLIPVMVGVSVAGLALRRVPRARIVAVGWLTGAVALWLLLGGFYAYDWLL